MKRANSFILLAKYLYMSGVGLLSPVYALFVLQIRGDAFIAGASWSFYLMTAGLTMIVFAKKADLAKSYQPFLIAGYGIAAFSTYLYLFVDTIPQLFVLQFVHAIGIGILTPSLRAVYSGNQNKKNQAYEWALFDGGIFILQGFAAFVGGFLVVVFSFDTLIMVMGGLQVLSVVFVLQAGQDAKPAK